MLNFSHPDVYSVPEEMGQSGWGMGGYAPLFRLCCSSDIQVFVMVTVASVSFIPVKWKQTRKENSEVLHSVSVFKAFTVYSGQREKKTPSGFQCRSCSVITSTLEARL